MRLVKKAVDIGNGAAVYVPKEYSGREIILLLPEGIQEIKQRVLSTLIEFMPNILGVYLFGSYARNENTQDSDVDILVITKEKDKSIAKALIDIDARVTTLETIKKTLKNHPLFIYPILRESRPLLNSFLLEELKNLKIDIKKFNWDFEDIKRIIRIIESFVALDEKDIVPAHIYSLIMRVRILHLIECIIENKEYANSSVYAILENRGLKKELIVKFFKIYRNIRDDKEEEININKEEINSLIDILKNYLKKVEDETKKKTSKRN